MAADISPRKPNPSSYVMCQGLPFTECPGVSSQRYPRWGCGERGPQKEAGRSELPASLSRPRTGPGGLTQTRPHSPQHGPSSCLSPELGNEGSGKGGPRQPPPGLPRQSPTTKFPGTQPRPWGRRVPSSSAGGEGGGWGEASSPTPLWATRSPLGQQILTETDGISPPSGSAHPCRLTPNFPGLGEGGFRIPRDSKPPQLSSGSPAPRRRRGAAGPSRANQRPRDRTEEGTAPHSQPQPTGPGP